MTVTDFLRESMVFLGAAAVAVPLATRFGLGSVLGYLAAGALIGPHVLGLVSADPTETMHFGELGVVLLLFVIGLELAPERLWRLRRAVFGSGGLQLVLTGVILFAISLLLGQSWQVSLWVGLALALSSTAFALQMLEEKRELDAPHGQQAFAVLLLQDLAVIPMLALLPLVGGLSTVDTEQSTWLAAGKAIAVIVGVVLAGRFVFPPIMRLVGRAGSRDAFTAFTLVVALGTAYVVNLAGLSMALGAFLAGVMLANSTFRHELEADIEPFRGLLLGLFFITIGMTIDFDLLFEQPLQLLGMALGLIAVKTLVLWAIGHYFAGLGNRAALRMAVAIAQGGEFAFVLFSVGASTGALQTELTDALTLAVTLSIAVSPLLYALVSRWPLDNAARAYDAIENENPKVIIAGFGRFGQIIGRILNAQGICFTVLEKSAEQVDFVARFGNKVYYGDAARPELLRAAGIKHAKALVVAVDDADAAMKITEFCHSAFPELRLFARARNRQHAFLLANQGCVPKHVVRETLHSSLVLCEKLLEDLGYSHADSQRMVATFQAHDEELLAEQAKLHEDQDKLIESAKQAREDLRALFDADQADPKIV